MDNSNQNETLTKYNPLSAEFFFQSCLKLNINQKECILDQIAKYNNMIQDDKTRLEFKRLANVYLNKLQ